MNKAALLLDGRFIYWRSIILALAILTAMLMATALRLGQKKQRLGPLLIAFPIAMAFSLCASRAIHWYCRFETYESFRAAMTDFTGGGWSLMGVFAGTIAALCLVRALFLTRDLPALLDAVSPAAALGIAVGRLGEYFSNANRSKFIFRDPRLLRVPFSAPAVNVTSGVTEWRAATFFGQSGWALLLFVTLFLHLVIPRRRRPYRESWRSGRVFELFMILYCLGQILFDSTRYDALFLRSNGFVSLEQIVCGVVLVAVLILYTVRSVIANRFHVWQILLWLAALAGLGLAGYMEYYVQRHADQFLFAYGMMADGLLIFFCAALAMYRSTTLPPEKRGAGAAQSASVEFAESVEAPPAAEAAAHPEADEAEPAPILPDLRKR